MSDPIVAAHASWEDRQQYLYELWDEVSDWEGLFVGQLKPHELERLEEAIREGLARKSFEGVSGFLGLSKVRMIY